ncbi:NAD-dependent histone deacetylase HST3 [Wallemia ichthyophaga EXF-994]|uniref:NAD-dependent histone deacetylase HST3 n=1 Tax=Wallemia ichthyophaga (strain EXF-994 / CBS 113033) TaxID=1299270 RepID=R9ARK4_WALI9|nr:NAD-dependent histone deacetylase HST3 [Wallemia ichthyophaga EXF-994]EOR04798.1 NAD-dependent histone deacetylase HST3 [Wallemia ichthyophaga EXF-994]TIB30004.1 hypothetical protein E3P84_03489 [Wallemia ichthyophaga]TIB39564.1 hypothetical protein E3P83_03421 [Wallemia ichthyophaga]
MQTISLSDDGIEHRKALDSLNSKIIKSRRIIVVSGAGISCSSGIPDFRSKEGLYDLVKDKFSGNLSKGQDLFDAQLFRDASTTSFFYSFIAQLKLASDRALPSPTHKFFKNLETKGRLLHSYTQNVDGLEQRVGLNNLINLHGSLNQVRCASCSFVGDMSSEYLQVFAGGQSPKCPLCAQRATERKALGKRPLAVGCLRPGIVLYNENHWSGDSIAKAQSSDVKKKPDLLIVMGTSLKVHGLKQLVKGFSRTIHQNNLEAIGNSRKTTGSVVFVNATPAAGKEWSQDFDYFVHGTSDEFVNKLTEQWKSTRPQDWQIQTTITHAHRSTKKNTVNAKNTAKLHEIPPHNDGAANKSSINSVNSNMGSPQPTVTAQLADQTSSPVLSTRITQPIQETNHFPPLPNKSDVSPRSRKRKTTTTSTIKRSVSSTQKGIVDVSILKKNKSEDLSLNFDLKLGDGSETEPEEDNIPVPTPTPSNARRSVRIRNSTIAAAA